MVLQRNTSEIFIRAQKDNHWVSIHWIDFQTSGLYPKVKERSSCAVGVGQGSCVIQRRESRHRNAGQPSDSEPLDTVC